MAVPSAGPTPRHTVSAKPRLFAALACALVVPCVLAQVASTADAALLDLDGPAVRAVLERAAAAESGRPPKLELAAELYCRAASYGSLEAAFRLGRMVLAGRGMPRDLPMAATLFSIASSNGHNGAGRMLLLTGIQEERLPPCLAESTGK